MLVSLLGMNEPKLELREIKVSVRCDPDWPRTRSRPSLSPRVVICATADFPGFPPSHLLRSR